jgi:hypothetical protein
VARRRYRSDALSAAGHGVKPDEPAPSGELPLSDAEPSSPQPPKTDEAEAKPDQPAEAISGLKAQINAMRQQPPQQPQQQVDPLAHYLASIPGLTIPKFQFLYHYFSRFPQNLNPQHWDVLKAAHGIALDRGVNEDSPEYFGFLHSLLLNQQAAASPLPHAAPAPPMPPPVHEPEPEPQHATHIDLEKVENPEGEPEEPHMTHYAAPVSRGSERYAMGDYEPSANSVRLSKAEVEHAEASGISTEEYAKQKLRMMKMKKAKLIRDE